MKGIPQHIFPTAFSSCPSDLLSIYATAYKYWVGHHLSISESCVWNFLPNTGTQTRMKGALRYA